MKLQSQATMRFDRSDLRRLAERTRPGRPWSWRAWAAAGAATGLLIVAIVRLL